MTNFRQKIGASGEKLVLNYYLKQGYALVVKNFEARLEKSVGRLGEIDLVFRLEKAKTLVVVEVKTRQNKKYGNVLEQVNPAKIKNMMLVTQFFLSQKEYQTYNQYFVRFDLAGVYQNEIKVVKNLSLD